MGIGGRLNLALKRQALCLCPSGTQQAPECPGLVIEILSEATRRLDTVLKRQTYERFEVWEYWLVDPHRQSIDVWTLTAEGYGRGVTLRAEEGAVLTKPLLPGLEISVAEIFEKEAS